MNVYHTDFGHSVGGGRGGLGAQSGQLAVPGLLPVEGGVVHRVCGAGPPVGAGGADGGAVESTQWMIRTIETGVWSVGGGDAHPSLLEQVRVCIQGLAPPGERVALPTQVLVRLDISSLQDGAGTGGDGAHRRVGGGQPLPGEGGAAGYGTGPGTERDSGR